MKCYVIDSKYSRKVRIIELELEEKPKTYKVLKSGAGFWRSAIRKDEVDKFISDDEQVICFDLDKGLKIYENGINELIKKETERHFKAKNRFIGLKDSLMDDIEIE